MQGRLTVTDLDGTLTRKDSGKEFAVFVCGKFRSLMAVLFLSPAILLYLTGFLSGGTVKQWLFMVLYKGLSQEFLTEKGRQFALTRLPQLIYPTAEAMLTDAKTKGHKIVILTAGCDLWIKPWCEKNGFHFLGSGLGFAHGKCTGRLVGKNCHGPEKERRLREFMNPGDTCSLAFGNSRHDRFFMRMADSSFIMKKGSFKKWKE